MKCFLLLFVFFLTSCASDRTYETETYFIDSNVSADVYCDDKHLGRTPLRINTSLTCKMTLKKEGYNSPSFSFDNIKKYHSGRYDAFPSENISNRHGFLTNGTKDFQNATDNAIKSSPFSLVSRDLTKFIKNGSSDEIIALIVSGVPFFLPFELVFTDIPVLAGGCVLFVIDGTLDILALPLDVTEVSVYSVKTSTEIVKTASENTVLMTSNAGMTSYEASSIDIVIPYDRDSYFFELIPKDKKAFTAQDLDELKTKLFVLKNFNELKASSPEYAQTLAMLTGKPFVRPEPRDNPNDYFRTLSFQRRIQ